MLNLMREIENVTSRAEMEIFIQIIHNPLGRSSGCKPMPIAIIIGSVHFQLEDELSLINYNNVVVKV